MGGKYLVEMLGRQIAARLIGDRLLDADHQRIAAAAQQHHHREQDVHDADPLMVDTGDPFAPEIGHVALQRDPGEHREDDDQHHTRRNQRDRLIDRNRRPAELTEHRCP